MAGPGRRAGDTDPGTAVVLVPVKAFDRAKGRLADALDPAAREALARRLATTVVEAARPIPVAVVCDDEAVAAWARDVGAAVVWTPGLDLNGSIGAAADRLADAGVDRAVVAHADLPFATDLAHLAAAEPDEVVLVADRHRDGTNVASIPLGRGFGFRYGPGSFARHRAEAARLGLPVRVVDDEALAWDVDGPEDLAPPPRLGTLEVGT